MRCMYLKVRTKKYEKYIYCQRRKKKIKFIDCENCKGKKFKDTAPIKKASSKQRKMERDRDKDLIKKGKCEYCERYFNKLDPHEVYGGSNRKRSINNKFVALLCRYCHDDDKALNELKIKYQKEYEKEHTREDFIKLIGKSYIKGND